MASKTDKLGKSLPSFSKKVATKVAMGGKVSGKTYVKRDPAERKAELLKEFGMGEEFFEAVKDNAQNITNAGGQKVSVSCIPIADLQEYLGTKSGSPSAIQGAAKRRLALAGVVTAKGKGRAIVYDSDDKLICIFPDRLEKAPGANLQTKVVYAKAATQGSQKFGSLIKSYESVGLTVNATTDQVVKWLTETGRFTGRKKPRKGGAPAPVKAPAKKGKK